MTFFYVGINMHCEGKFIRAADLQQLVRFYYDYNLACYVDMGCWHHVCKSNGKLIRALSEGIKSYRSPKGGDYY